MDPPVPVKIDIKTGARARLVVGLPARGDFLENESYALNLPWHKFLGTIFTTQIAKYEHVDWTERGMGNKATVYSYLSLRSRSEK